jgi:carboxypeptidase Q
VITPSTQGDGGTLFVASALVPGPGMRGTNSPTNAPRAWATNAPAIPPQMTLATEDYNRLVRMIKQGEKLKMMVDMQVQFHDEDLMAYNTIAEIPGTDLKDEIVMIGGHLDSWHSGTGATDNAAGVGVTMEAMRILQAVKLQPRRTVRIGLWTGEEQGLLGSKAYVGKHFGYYTNITNSATTRSPRDDSPGARSLSSRNRSTRQLVRNREYERFSTYFNLDNGTGRIRGVYMQGNESVRPFFRNWLEPFYDLGAETLTLSNTGGTDHQSFDGIGLPGFQFIQDPIDYFSRTHHSNADVFDRIQADDLKQASTIMAAFVYKAATIDERLPRKPLPEEAGGDNQPSGQRASLGSDR